MSIALNSSGDAFGNLFRNPWTNSSRPSSPSSNVFSKRCSGVILRGVRARSIDIHRSSVFAEDLGVEGGPIGIKMWRSRLRVSGGTVTGEVALELGGSEVDFAGVTLIGKKAAVVGTADVNFLCSLCRLDSPVGRLRLHGLREFSVGDQL